MITRNACAGKEGSQPREALQSYLGHDILPTFCLMFSQVAAACANASNAIAGDRLQVRFFKKQKAEVCNAIPGGPSHVFFKVKSKDWQA
jgi:hypothetical protein